MRTSPSKRNVINGARRALFIALTSTSLALAYAAMPGDADINAKGAFTCDFALSSDFPPSDVGPVIERDRIYMSERPGMLFKQLPIRIDNNTGQLLSGGRYLFDTENHAKDYKRWVQTRFALDGTLFFDRPYFLDPECHAWSVIGAHDFAPRRASQFVLRTERWHVSGDAERLLKDRWPAVKAAAQQRGLTSVWLLQSKDEKLVSLVYFADRVAPPDPNVPDFASLFALETAPALGQIFADQNWTKYFDRTHWVLTVWFPFEARDYGEPALWPYSPPLPGPYCGDGVCEVSRGERNATCPGDCPTQCGDGVCQPGEDTHNCPGDCRLE